MVLSIRFKYWINNMDQERCTFDNSDHCNSVGLNDNLEVITDTRLKTVKEKSKKRKDILHTKLEKLPSSTVLQTHDASISRYTSDCHIEKYLNRKKKEQSETKWPQTVVTCRSSGSRSFVWKLHFLFCVELCALEKDSKNPRRWRNAFLC